MIKFGVDVPYEKIMLFKSAVESFVKARPREWLLFVAFRATRVEYDAAFVEYITVLQHVEVRIVNTWYIIWLFFWHKGEPDSDFLYCRAGKI